LAKQLPKKALLGDVLTDEEYEKSFDELFCYFDLSNEQVSLRRRARISLEVWRSWCEGIETNLALPAFARAWNEVKQRSSSFQELRRLESEKFQGDPKEWHEP
jgi:hypothetical protein